MTISLRRLPILLASVFVLSGCEQPTQPELDPSAANDRPVGFQVFESGAASVAGTANYYVHFWSPMTASDLELLESTGTARYAYGFAPIAVVRLTDAAASALQQSPRIAKVVKGGGVLQLSIEEQWGVTRIEAPTVWANEGNKGSGVKVAFLDSGVDAGHPDLVANIKGTVNFVAGQPNTDDTGHGTHIAGIIGALDNGTGVAGVAPLSSLYSVKVCDPDIGGCPVEDIAAGIDWAINNGMDIINMSLGACPANLPQPDVTVLQAAVEAAETAGLLIVAAAGNGNCSTVDYPAKFDEVIAVAGVDASDSPPSAWSSGSQVEVAAPGVAVPSTFQRSLSPSVLGCSTSPLGTGYAVCSGTSMASPHVSGVAALIMAEFPFMSVATVRSNLRFFTSRQNDQIGYGIVNAGKSATNTPLPTVDGEQCLFGSSTETYTALTTGGGGGNSWVWFRDREPFGVWVPAGSGQSRSFFFPSGNYREQLRVEVTDKWGKTGANVMVVIMQFGSGIQGRFGGPLPNLTACGGGGGPPE